MSADLQDAVTLARSYRLDVEIETAIACTWVELAHVRGLIKIRGRTAELVTDELQVLARLADLKIQARLV